MESLLSVTPARLPNVGNTSDAAPSKPAIRNVWGKVGVGVGGCFLTSMSGTSTPLESAQAAERLLEFRREQLRRDSVSRSRRDDGDFSELSPCAGYLAPPHQPPSPPSPPSVSHLTIHFSPPSGPSPAKSSDFAEAALNLSPALVLMRRVTCENTPPISAAVYESKPKLG